MVFIVQPHCKLLVSSSIDAVKIFSSSCFYSLWLLEACSVTGRILIPMIFHANCWQLAAVSGAQPRGELAREGASGGGDGVRGVAHARVMTEAP
jgi:hypothetical protein